MPRVLGPGAEYHGAGGVAEQDAGVAIRPVEHGRKDFRADDQDVPALAGVDEEGGHVGGVDEPGAGGGHVEGEGLFGADLGLDETGRGREGLVRIDIGADDAVDVQGA